MTLSSKHTTTPLLQGKRLLSGCPPPVATLCSSPCLLRRRKPYSRTASARQPYPVLKLRTPFDDSSRLFFFFFEIMRAFTTYLRRSLRLARAPPPPAPGMRRWPCKMFGGAGAMVASRALRSARGPVAFFSLVETASPLPHRASNWITASGRATGREQREEGGPRGIEHMCFAACKQDV